ncbi:MAG: LacI family DNA-binding transcriptional regulator [Verrucomicrobia bacterium]|nr:LacI family DNA-binding transcriptional regulator [Verrucomicrobiota bacterium]
MTAVLIPRRRSRPTLADIAADAGVSRATVSLVIRNVPTVADGTRQRVMSSLRRLGYVYNRGAASLRSQRSHAVGLVVSDITNPFFAELIVAIEDRLAAAGYITVFGNTSERPEKQVRLLTRLAESAVDGILICPTKGTNSEFEFTLPSVPVVAFARTLPGVDYVGLDNHLGASLATKHLFQLGHRRVAFFGGLPELSSSQERLEGYLSAHQEAGRTVNEELIFSGPPNQPGGRQAVTQALRLSTPPSAGLCFNDLVALGAMEALRAGGLEPPRFALVGYDNIAIGASVRPALTTVDAVPAEVGKAAAELLLQRLSEPASTIQRRILEPRLIVRESCGAGTQQREVRAVNDGRSARVEPPDTELSGRVE